MEYWHGACEDPARLTDSDRGKFPFFKCSSVCNIDENDCKDCGLSLNDWQLAPEVVLGSRGYRSSCSSNGSSSAGKHDDSSDSINGDGSQEQVAAASFATLLYSRFVAVCPSKPQPLYSHN